MHIDTRWSRPSNTHHEQCGPIVSGLIDEHRDALRGLPVIDLGRSPVLSAQLALVESVGFGDAWLKEAAGKTL